MDRSEDLKQVRDLHLVRDERDREVEAAAGLRAGNAVVLVSQLLSAVCLLQDDPAWMALLSLTLVWGGVKGFWRFRQDQERIYLVWGLLTCAGAAALLGLYFHRAWSAGMSFTRLLGYAVLCQVLTVAAGLLFVALLLGIFWLAHKLGHIEGERWEQYFQSVSTAGLLLRMGAVMAAALAAVGAILYCNSYPQIKPDMGNLLGLKAFVAAVFGGIGSIPGAVIGAFLIGICENFVKIMPFDGATTFVDAFTFALLIIILVFKPTGLFGEKATDKV